MQFDVSSFEMVKQIFKTLTDTSQTFSDQDFLEKNNRMSVALSNVACLSGLFAQVHPDDAVRKQAEDMEQQVSALITQISLSRPLYDRFVAVDRESLDAQAKRYVEKTLEDFRRSGVDKSESVRGDITRLNEELVFIGQEFSRNIREDVRFISLDSPDDLAGLPEDYIASHAPDDDGRIRITTDYPDVVPFLRYAKNASARKALAFEFKNRAYPKNIEVLDRLLQKRFELVQLLGYENWAAYVSEDKMVKHPKNIEKFIVSLDRVTYQKAKKEYGLLLEAKRQEFPDAIEVEGWESQYYEEQVKQKQFAFDSQAVRPYFEYHRVKQGIFDTISRLFGLRFESVDAPTWHESVEVFDVFDQSKIIGRIYLDMHPRENKYKHAAQFGIKNGVRGMQKPEGALVCNFPDPKSAPGGKAYLDHTEVTTFFHEFGHLMHFILSGHHVWDRTSGISVEWDFVEAPSQFLEEWAWEPEVLQTFAIHEQTGEPIPEDLVQKMRAADQFGKALFVKQQTFYSALSLHYYAQNPTGLDTTALLEELQNKYSMFAHTKDTHMQTSFGHLDGYSAIYYTYMWSLVISKDLLTPFLAGGMMNRDVAKKYRESILEVGGTRDADAMIQQFLGRPYSFDAFQRWVES